MSDNDIVRSNILVVDDEREHAQVMCEALTRLGHRCDVTYNLPEAKSKLDRKSYGDSSPRMRRMLTCTSERRRRTRLWASDELAPRSSDSRCRT